MSRHKVFNNDLSEPAVNEAETSSEAHAELPDSDFTSHADLHVEAVGNESIGQDQSASTDSVEACETGNGENGDSGDDHKAEDKHKKRIGAKAIEEERRRVLEHNGLNPEASDLAISIDLGIPEERVRRYLAEDKENSSPIIVVRLNKVVDHLRRRLKTATGEDLKADSPLKVEFSEDVVLISPYTR